jgi:hypothetical protein
MTEIELSDSCPRIMPHQWSAFNNDNYVAEEVLKLKEKFKCTVFCETGTCLGSTSTWAAEHFKNAVTFEIHAPFFEIAKKRKEIRGTKNLEQHFINSVDGLKEVLPKLKDKNILFFLDAHFNSYCPLLDELKTIKENNLTPVIVIHDCKVPNEPNLGYDKWNGVEISYETVKPYLDEIYGEKGYTHYYNSDKTSTEIKRGVIYIVPNE